MNFNPTLSKPIQPTTNQSVYRQHYQYGRKRTFHSMNNSHYNGQDQYGPNPNSVGAQPQKQRRKRQKYQNDGGLTDAQMEKILAARKKEEEQGEVERYLDERKRNFPSRANVAKKREMITVKKKRGQLLSINEKIMNYSDRTGNKGTPSSLRFLETPKFSNNIVRKVLKREIDQEYSAVLQCFRYLVQTDFLSKELEEKTVDDGEEGVHPINGSNDGVNAEDGVIIEDTGRLSGHSNLPFSLKDIQRDEAMLDEEGEDDEDLDFAFNEILAQQPQGQIVCALTSSDGVAAFRRH